MNTYKKLTIYEYYKLIINFENLCFNIIDILRA